MTFKMPELGYLTYDELRERWNCTDNQLRQAIFAGEIKPAIFVDGNLSIPTWAHNKFDGWHADDNQQDGQGEDVFVRYCGLLYLQSPIRDSAWDCEFRLGSNILDPVTPTEPWGNNNWYWLPERYGMLGVQRDGLFLLSQVRDFEKRHSATGEPAKPQSEKPLGDRERRTLYNIIHGLSLYLDSQNLSNAKAIKWLADNGYRDFEGLSKSTMELKFAEAKRSFSQQ